MLGNEETRFSIQRHYSLQLAGDDSRRQSQIRRIAIHTTVFLGTVSRGTNLGALLAITGLGGLGEWLNSRLKTGTNSRYSVCVLFPSRNLSLLYKHNMKTRFNTESHFYIELSRNSPLLSHIYAKNYISI